LEQAADGRPELSLVRAAALRSSSSRSAKGLLDRAQVPRQADRPVRHGDALWLPRPAPRSDLVIIDASVIDKAGDTMSSDPSRIVAGDLANAAGRGTVAVTIRHGSHAASHIDWRLHLAMPGA
jgi:hypothetical protein